MDAAGNLAGCPDAGHGGGSVFVDHETAILVVQDGIDGDQFGQGIEAGLAVATQHVGKRDFGVSRIDGATVKMYRGAARGSRDPSTLGTFADDRRGDDVARCELVDELLAGGVAQQRTVGARRLGHGVACQGFGPSGPRRVSLERVVVSLGAAESNCESRDLTRRAIAIGREFAGLLGLPLAASACG